MDDALDPLEDPYLRKLAQPEIDPIEIAAKVQDGGILAGSDVLGTLALGVGGGHDIVRVQDYFWISSGT
jgi:hypothetical protein